MIKIEEVRKSLEILKGDPSNVSANYLISCYLAHTNRLHEVYPFISKVAESDSNIKGTNLILGKYYWEKEKKFLKAIRLYKKELSLHPDSSLAMINLARALIQIGEISEGIKYLKQILALNPKDILTSDSLLMHLHYKPDCSHEELLEHAKKHTQNIFKDSSPYKNTKENFQHLQLLDMKPRLKVGFVSGDFKQHSIVFFIKNLFPELNKYCDVYCYCNNKHDNMTQTLKAESQEWRDILGVTTVEAVEIIKKDQIDVLVDLSGHTGKNRLDIFIEKPCPVQVSWIGQAGPLALHEIDYMLCNNYLVPREEDRFYREKPFRLAGIYAPFVIPLNNIEITPTPCLENGYITFGCLNNFIKINQDLLLTWVEILGKVSNSKLFLKSSLFADSEFIKRIQDFFENKGIDSCRLILETHDSIKLDYINKYNKIDIALDSFPVGGNTTTNDLLFMGVPVIALYGKRMSQRSSADLLKVMGCDELIANTKEDYIEKAVTLASDFERINNYKNTLRSRYTNSPICDTKSFAKELSTAFSSMWQETIAGLG